jgi:hypothetical protein
MSLGTRDRDLSVQPRAAVCLGRGSPDYGEAEVPGSNGSGAKACK